MPSPFIATKQSRKEKEKKKEKEEKKVVYRSVYPRHFKNPEGKCTFENWLSVVSSRGGENFQGLLSQGDVWLTGVRIILHVYIAPLIMFFSLFLSFFLL